MESPHIYHPGRLLPYHTGYPLLHLPGCLVGKCQRQNAIWFVSVRKYVSNLASKHLGFPAASSSHYQRWPRKTHNSLFLSWVQPFQNIVPYIFHNRDKYTYFTL